MSETIFRQDLPVGNWVKGVLSLRAVLERDQETQMERGFLVTRQDSQCPFVEMEMNDPRLPGAMTALVRALKDSVEFEAVLEARTEALEGEIERMASDE